MREARHRHAQSVSARPVTKETASTCTEWAAKSTDARSGTHRPGSIEAKVVVTTVVVAAVVEGDDGGIGGDDGDDGEEHDEDGGGDLDTRVRQYNRRRNSSTRHEARAWAATLKAWNRNFCRAGDPKEAPPHQHARRLRTVIGRYDWCVHQATPVRDASGRKPGTGAPQKSCVHADQSPGATPTTSSFSRMAATSS